MKRLIQISVGMLLVMSLLAASGCIGMQLKGEDQPGDVNERFLSNMRFYIQLLATKEMLLIQNQMDEEKDPAKQQVLQAKLKAAQIKEKKALANLAKIKAQWKAKEKARQKKLEEEEAKQIEAEQAIQAWLAERKTVRTETSSLKPEMNWDKPAIPIMDLQDILAVIDDQISADKVKQSPEPKTEDGGKATESGDGASQAKAEQTSSDTGGKTKQAEASKQAQVEKEALAKAKQMSNKAKLAKVENGLQTVEPKPEDKPLLGAIFKITPDSLYSMVYGKDTAKTKKRLTLEEELEKDFGDVEKDLDEKSDEYIEISLEDVKNFFWKFVIFKPTPFKIKCFAGNARVLVSRDKAVPIADLAKDSTVYAYDEKTGNFSQHKIVQYETDEAARFMMINDGLLVTGMHRFLLEDGSWVRAKDIKVGMKIKSLDGVVPIRDVQIVKRPMQPIYTFDVGHAETFVVTADGKEFFVVHNGCGAK